MVEHRPSSHLPQCPLDAERYDRLYAFNRRADDYTERMSKWHERRIPSRLSEVDVYRLLPSAKTFEFGGYLTGSRIRFRRCGALRAELPMSRLCTFHSHPTQAETADTPSAEDVFQFLNFRHLRTVTVGRTRIWVWDKTSATLKTVHELAAWVPGNSSAAIRRLKPRFPNSWYERYVEIVLKYLGLKRPRNFAAWETQWPELLQCQLRIQVRIFPRETASKQP